MTTRPNRAWRTSILAWALAALALPAAAEPPSFEQDVRPVLEQHCVRCHGERRPKAGIDLGRFADASAVQKDVDLWLQVVDAVELRTMPPPGEEGPSEEERHRVVESVNAIIDAIDEINDPGRELIQRLTREQYNNTIRDLLGVDTRPADAFPSDGGGGAGFDNNASTLFVPPILLEKYLSAAAEVLEQADPDRYLIARPGEDVSDEEVARICLERFASRAFRRPVQEEEVDRLMGLFRLASERGDPFEVALRLPLRAVLVSPHFLFLGEQDRDSAEPYRISDFELANRLSYFLWASMPDDELFDLAAEGSLHDPEVLDRQVARMLADPKSRAFAESFAGQWLRVAELDEAAQPDRRLFPEYTPELREAMVEEPITFFHELLKNDEPVLDLLDADYTYVNELLAEHYGIEGVEGTDFRRVALEDPNRGGVMGMAAVLTLTSYPRRTSPVLRGKWVLEEILGTPPPPPPPMVGILPQDDRPRDGLTFRQRLEEHRNKPSCASCHSKLDPLGFGLENFDAIGRWREEISGEPVDSTGKFATGEEFQGPAALKAILVKSRRDLFVRNLVERMLSYALRRGVEYYDTPTVGRIAEALEAEGFRSNVLIAEIARSYPFQYRRGAEGPSEPDRDQEAAD